MHQLWPYTSSTPAMADAAARRHYASKTKPKSVKQKAWEGSAAHHEHVGAKSETGEATVKRGGVHSGHGGENNDDGGAQVTVMDKMSKQPVIEHHGIKAELAACQARAKTDRGALATAKRARRRCCRPRGRKAASGGSWRNRATTVGCLSTQGVGEAIERFALTVEALQRWCELVGDEQGRREK